MDTKVTSYTHPSTAQCVPFFPPISYSAYRIGFVWLACYVPAVSCLVLFLLMNQMCLFMYVVSLTPMLSGVLQLLLACLEVSSGLYQSFVE